MPETAASVSLNDASAAARARRVGMACAAASALLFAAKAIVAKLTYRYGVPVETVVVLRLALAAPVMAALAWHAGRGRERLARADHARIAALGVAGLYASTYLDFAGLAHVTAAFERLVLFLNPTFVLLLAAVVLRRPPTRRQWAAVAVAYAGVGVVFAHEIARGGSGDVRTGGALVLASALIYAVYLTASAEVTRRIGPMRLTASVAVWAALAALVHAGAASVMRGGGLFGAFALPDGSSPCRCWACRSSTRWRATSRRCCCSASPSTVSGRPSRRARG